MFRSAQLSLLHTVQVETERTLTTAAIA